MRIRIENLWMTQRNLRRAEQIPKMVEDIMDVQALPAVEILELPDGSREINDGHHRSVAMYVAGIKYLEHGEFTLLPVAESWKRRCYKVKDCPLLPQIIEQVL